MRAVLGRTVSASELRWLQLLVDASQSWASRLNKSIWESVAGTRKNKAFCFGQAQVSSISETGETNWRFETDDHPIALVINRKRGFLEEPAGSRRNQKLVGASMGKCPRSSLDFFLRGFAGRLETFFGSKKCLPMDFDNIWSSNGYCAIKRFKKMQESRPATFHSLSPDEKQLENSNSDCFIHIFSTCRCEGIGKRPFQVLTNLSFKPNRDCLAGRPYLSQSFGCLRESCRNSHVQSVSLFRRAFSLSTEEFDEDVGGMQPSVSSHQHSSSEGQQSSLELPDSKPISGPSWPNPDNAASYVLMSNIYADGDRWDEVKRINEMRLKARAWKKPGKAYIEIKAKVHEFIVGDRTHQDSTNIYEKLRKIKRHMGHIGYVPYVDLVLENRSYHDPYYKPR